MAIKVGSAGKLTGDGVAEVACDILHQVDTPPHRDSSVKAAICYFVCRRVNVSLKLPKIKSLIQCAQSRELALTTKKENAASNE